MALDSSGNVLAESENAHARQDPASTTKLWTLYTIMAMQRDGRIPADFIAKHAQDISEMMVRSNNELATSLASEAAKAAGKSGAITSTELDIVPDFAEFMNEYAQKGDKPLAGTRFVTSSGMPDEDHYSTAYDMALMTHRFRTDFKGTSIESAVSFAGLQEVRDRRTGKTSGNTGSSIAEFEDPNTIGKTGTAAGVHGSSGKYSFVGATEKGSYALAGAFAKEDRIELAKALAKRTHDSNVKFPPMINDDSYSYPISDAATPEEKAAHQKEAAARKKEAEAHNEFMDRGAIDPNLSPIMQFFMNLLGAIFGIQPDRLMSWMQPSSGGGDGSRAGGYPSSGSGDLDLVVHESSATSVAAAASLDSLSAGLSSNGKARLVTVNAPASGSKRRVESAMQLISPTGEVLWQGDLVTGGWGNGALPGMDASDLATAGGSSYANNKLVAFYPLLYDAPNSADRRPGKPSFSYANGDDGFFIALGEASNQNALSRGQYRYAFGIHPGYDRLLAKGQDPASEGCVKLANDANARLFYQKIKELRAQGIAPEGLEIMNGKMLEREHEAEVLASNVATSAKLNLAYADVSEPDPAPSFRAGGHSAPTKSVLG